MAVNPIAKNIYWVGARDWNVRDFHGYKTQRGTSYNSYLILGEKVVLIDTVKADFSSTLIDHISEIIHPSKIDIIISNHSEPDHSGALPEIQKQCPQALIYSTFQGVQALSSYYNTTGWNFKEVDNLSEINIGDYRLQFLHTNQVHWPDSMVTYCPEEKLLFSNDAFGQHLAEPFLFDDEVSKDILFYETEKYYANIIYPLGEYVKRALDGLKQMDIQMIAPSHGLIWRNDIPKILKKYESWAQHQHEKKAIIVYDSMWGSTEQMACLIQESFSSLGIPARLFSLKDNHISDIMTEILEARFVAIGSPSLNNTIMPSVGALMTYMKGLSPKNKWGLTFGSYGWNRNAQKEIQKVMLDLKWNLPVDPINFKYRADQETKEAIKGAVKKLCLL